MTDSHETGGAELRPLVQPLDGPAGLTFRSPRPSHPARAPAPRHAPPESDDELDRRRDAPAPRRAATPATYPREPGRR